MYRKTKKKISANTDYTLILDNNTSWMLNTGNVPYENSIEIGIGSGKCFLFHNKNSRDKEIKKDSKFTLNKMKSNTALDQDISIESFNSVLKEVFREKYNKFIDRNEVNLLFSSFENNNPNDSFQFLARTSNELEVIVARSEMVSEKTKNKYPCLCFLTGYLWSSPISQFEKTEKALINYFIERSRFSESLDL